MRRILFIAVLSAIVFASCDEQFSNIEEFVSQEIIYPGRYDFARVQIGFERVEIDLLEAGRIPSEEIRLGKAVRTIVEYDDEVVVFEGLHSWLSVEGLTRQKMYSFRIFTEDEFGNRSVPVEPDEPVMPFFASDAANLTVPQPRISMTARGVLLSWPRTLLDRMMRHAGLEFEYVDPSGTTHNGEGGPNANVLVINVNPGDDVTIELVHNVIPVINGLAILDTVRLSQQVDLRVPPFTRWTNVAIGKRVLVSSEGDENSSGKNAVSENINEIWAPTNPVDNSPQWIEIDLAAGYDIEAFEIFTSDDNPLKSFRFQTWFRDMWVDRLDVTDNTESEFLGMIDKTTTSRVRLLTTEPDIEIRQIAVYVIDDNPDHRLNVALYRHTLVSTFRNANEFGYNTVDGDPGDSNSNDTNRRWVVIPAANSWMEIYFEAPVTIDGFYTLVDRDANRDHFRDMRFFVAEDAEYEEQHMFPYAFPNRNSRTNHTYTVSGLTYTYVPFVPSTTDVTWRQIYTTTGTARVQRLRVDFDEPVTTNKVRIEIDNQEVRLFQIEIYSTQTLF